MSRVKLPVTVLALVCVVLASALYLRSVRLDKARRFRPDVSTAEGLISVLPQAGEEPFLNASFDHLDGGAIPWDSCNADAIMEGKHTATPPTTGPIIQAQYNLSDGSWLVFSIAKMTASARVPFIRELARQPSSCVLPGEDTANDYSGSVETRIDMPEIGDASVAFRTAPMTVDMGTSRQTGPSGPVSAVHVVAVSQRWYVLAESTAADVGAFKRTLPLIFGHLNESLGTSFAYRGPDLGASRRGGCGPGTRDRSDGHALDESIFRTLMTLHDALCRRDYETLETLMSGNFTQNGIIHPTSRLLTEWAAGGEGARILREASEAFDQRGRPEGSIVVFSQPNIELRFDLKEVEWTSLVMKARPPATAGRSLLLLADWTQVAKYELQCGKLVPEKNPATRGLSIDFTRDGRPEAVVVMDCATGDGSSNDQVTVYDGASGPGRPRRLGVLVRLDPDGDAMRIRALSGTASRVDIIGAILRPGDPIHCSRLRIRQSFHWRQNYFEAGKPTYHRLRNVCA